MIGHNTLRAVFLRRTVACFAAAIVVASGSVTWGYADVYSAFNSGHGGKSGSAQFPISDAGWSANGNAESAGEGFPDYPSGLPNEGILFVDHQSRGGSGHNGQAVIEYRNNHLLTRRSATRSCPRNSVISTLCMGVAEVTEQGEGVLFCTRPKTVFGGMTVAISGQVLGCTLIQITRWSDSLIP